MSHGPKPGMLTRADKPSVTTRIKCLSLLFDGQFKTLMLSEFD